MEPHTKSESRIPIKSCTGMDAYCFPGAFYTNFEDFIPDHQAFCPVIPNKPIIECKNYELFCKENYPENFKFKGWNIPFSTLKHSTNQESREKIEAEGFKPNRSPQPIDLANYDKVNPGNFAWFHPSFKISQWKTTIQDEMALVIFKFLEFGCNAIKTRKLGNGLYPLYAWESELNKAEARDLLVELLNFTLGFTDTNIELESITWCQEKVQWLRHIQEDEMRLSELILTIYNFWLRFKSHNDIFNVFKSNYLSQIKEILGDLGGLRGFKELFSVYGTSEPFDDKEPARYAKGDRNVQVCEVDLEDLLQSYKELFEMEEFEIRVFGSLRYAWELMHGIVVCPKNQPECLCYPLLESLDDSNSPITISNSNEWIWNARSTSLNRYILTSKPKVDLGMIGSHPWNVNRSWECLGIAFWIPEGKMFAVKNSRWSTKDKNH